MTTPTITWTHSKERTAKSEDWYWALGILAVTGAIAAILMHNTLFALLIIIGSITLGLSAREIHGSHEERYAVSVRGVTVGNRLYSYQQLVGFWIDERDPEHPVLLLDAQEILSPHLVIPLADEVDRDALQDLLLDYLPETELYVPPTHRIAEILGF